jgi:hypothetical protein
LETLTPWTESVPTTELEWLRDHWGEAEPALVDILAEAAVRPLDHAENALSMYAMYLLAEQRSYAAFPHYLTICRLPEPELDALLGDILTQDMSRFLAATCAVRFDALNELVEDETAFEWSRAIALSALRDCVLGDQLPRNDLIRYLIHLLDGGLERVSNAVWDQVACVACDLHPGDLLPLIKHAYDQGLVDEGMVSWLEVVEASQRPCDHVMAESRRHFAGLIRPVEESVAWMEAFAPTRPVKESVPAEPPLSPAAWDGNALRPLRREAPKIGRNDPCPCGSGRKYKKCCGGN